MNLRRQIQQDHVNEVAQIVETHLGQILKGELKEDPFLLSLHYESPNVAQWLLEKEYHCLCSKEKQITFLESAALMNQHALLMNMVHDIPFTKKDLTNALYRATSSCDILVVKILLDEGAVIGEGVFSPLIQAIEMNNRDVAIFLIHETKATQSIDEDGWSLLHHVASAGRDQELLQYLIYKGLDLNLQDKRGRTPLMHAVLSVELDGDNFFSKISNTLVERGADSNIQDEAGDTTLMHACKFWNYIEGGADAMLEFVKKLVDQGARVDIRNHRGQTTLDIAMEHDFVEVVVYFEELMPTLTVPSTDVKENNNAASSVYEYKPSSFLSENGYSARLSRKKRWEVLQNDVLRSHSPQEVIDKLSSFIKRFKAQTNGPKKYADAIEEWEYDIERIEERYSSRSR
ncbi:ankyrin repeat domain-containing protein [Halobacillus litoralis]|uniref:ankyrin repeat domain-containing protein n=1 Tax=Halobacillus litoralis TaxID=45668 RepID=UPI001CD579DA|nr:ankyrin repeat domain-containing protein [Halobacillus litoralis]MCA0971366.1 ankyrin repeat domain-containing protein [Halobacillus litoralis]